ncbi:hypothetical protein JCM1840_001040 [Sporobolomyces johnsonii]
MGALSSTLTGQPGSPRRSGPFVPTEQDVHEMLSVLQEDGGLPTELAIQILNLAEYWPTITARSTRQLFIRAGWQGERQSQQVLGSEPIPAYSRAPEHPVRRVRVLTDSKDQGFSSFPQYHNTREGSSSWFEAALLRPDPPTPPSSPRPTNPISSRTPCSAMPGSFPSLSSSSDTPPPPPTPPPPASRPLRLVHRERLHSNLHAHRAFAPFETVLERGASPLVDLAQAGDRVVVFALAEYPAWLNKVRECRVAIEVAAM